MGAVPGASPPFPCRGRLHAHVPTLCFLVPRLLPAWPARLGEAAVSLPGGCQRVQPGRRAAAHRSGVGWDATGVPVQQKDQCK